MVFAMCLISMCVRGQYSFKSLILDADTKLPIHSVTITDLNTGLTYISDKNGFALINNLGRGNHVFAFSHISYKQLTDSFDIPVRGKDTVKVLLELLHDEIDEVIIVSTRTNRSFSNSPTRVEVLDSEELSEKNNMRPANVSMLLHESTGMQVQQTSATSATASIRMQGLDGRYTQLLKDGYPNFGNFAGGLSILEIPPLDLKQVEVIKGPASTLYGGGAIAGVVNFISKTPKEKPEYNFIFNQSNIGQTNAGAYLSGRKKKAGYSLLGLYNHQKAYDVDRDDFSELPGLKSFTINPTLFFFPSAAVSLVIGNSFSKADYLGGDMQVIDGKADTAHTYFEENRTIRNITHFELETLLKNSSRLVLKQSISLFNRRLSVPGYEFEGSNTNAFSDISYHFRKGKHNFVSGLNLIYERFTHKIIDSTEDQSAKSFTAGLYLQDTWDLSEAVKIEAGLRADHVNWKSIHYSRSSLFLLPRISLLARFSKVLSSRIGAGFGYKAPTIFTEQTEALQYRKIQALNDQDSEKSFGLTADINYRKQVTKAFSININQLFFYTNIRRPLVLQENSSGYYYFINAGTPVNSFGFETNLRLIFKENLKFFTGYTYTNAKASYRPGNTKLPLVPEHKLNLTLVYEKEDNFKLGIEGYFTGNQYLNNDNRTPSFWEFGAMAEKTIRKLCLFINFENFTDQRQSRYKPVVNPPHANPVFDDIWNHTEGFVLNGGVKLKI